MFQFEVDGVDVERKFGVQKKYITVVSHPFLSVIHFTDIDGTVYFCNTYFNIVLVFNDRWCVSNFSEAESFFADSRSYSMTTPSQPRLGGTQTREMQFNECTEHS